MLDADHWREIWCSLRANWLRTLLTAFGVFWGMFMLVVLLGSGKGLQNGVTSGFAGQATNSFFIWVRATSKPWRGFQRGRSFDMNLDDVVALRNAVPELGVIAPRLQLGGYGSGRNVTRGLKAGGFNVMGDIPDISRIIARRMSSGRFLDVLDIAERRKVCVIGSRVAETLFDDGDDPVGDRVTINGVDFQIVGVFSPMHPGDEGDRDSRVVHVPLSTFQRAFATGDRIGWLAVTAAPGVPASLAQRRALALLARRHDVAPDDDRAFGRWNTEDEYEKMQGLFGGVRALVWVVGLGTLAAGVIGVGNIMLVIVRERTHEIGVRRAIGATPGAIRGQIVVEALLLTSLSGWLGLAGGVAALELAGKVAAGDGGMFVQPGVDLGTAVEALAVLIVSGILAGLVPAQRALSISPVDALRSDA